jgi:hypothetical protein
MVQAVSSARASVVARIGSVGVRHMNEDEAIALLAVVAAVQRRAYPDDPLVTRVSWVSLRSRIDAVVHDECVNSDLAALGGEGSLEPGSARDRLYRWHVGHAG